MAYRVDISIPALADAEDAYFWVKHHSPTTAGDWYEGLLSAINSLENSPLRCPLAPENADVTLEVRQLLYGKRQQQYRVLFGIEYDDEAGEQIVRVYRIWHSARRKATAEDIKEGHVKQGP
ncbi:MAG: type II toxin-antitoxin system RelE/ParE family toxin [Acidobacteria bacterium]|nr:type II toxin-antitoxin system RelE/ParE family toxin [Acidobacteriota bacterium]